MQISQELVFTNTTKHTVRYDAVPSQPPQITAIYIQKWALPEPPPKAITLTVETK